MNGDTRIPVLCLFQDNAQGDTLPHTSLRYVRSASLHLSPIDMPLGAQCTSKGDHWHIVAMGEDC